MGPYEIFISPADLYLAPVGETWPKVNAAPAGNWKLFGSSGKQNYEESGITITHEQTLAQVRTLGTTGVIKVARTDENLVIALVLDDLTMEEYAKVLNNVAVNDVAPGAGTAGYREITMRQGFDVATMALLIRFNASPYGDSWKSQYQIPIVYQSANPAPVFAKGTPAGLQAEFTALEDPDAATEAERYGKIVAQDADPA